MILADTFDWGTFPDAFRFIVDHPALLWDKTVQHLALSRLWRADDLLPA